MKTYLIKSSSDEKSQKRRIAEVAEFFVVVEILVCIHVERHSSVKYGAKLRQTIL